MARNLAALCVGALLLASPALAVPSNDPPAGVAIVQITLAGGQPIFFLNCTEIGSETEVLESKQSLPNGQTVIVKTPGQTRYSNIVCTRSFSTDLTLSQWRHDVEIGHFTNARKDGTLKLLSFDLSEIATFSFDNGWPSSLKIGGIASHSDAPVSETVTIVIESLTRP